MGSSMHRQAVSGDSAHRDPVAVALGRRLGLLPSSAAQVLKGQLNYRASEVILSFTECREFERRDRWMIPILAAQAGVAEEKLTRALLVRAQQADSAEEAAETAYHTDPSPATAEQYLRAIDQQIVTSLAVRMALLRQRQEAAA